jgi:hypothetical protein
MEFKDANRSDVRMKMALAGKSGAGKTYGALKIAKGLVNDMSKVGIAQTEAGRAQCYLDDASKFKVLEMVPPFSPESFIEVIDKAERAGLKCLIIDSISDEWAGIGGSLDVHAGVSEVTKNSFTAWKKVTPRHDAVFNKILQSPIHIICTVKKKTETIMENVNGKSVPKKVGVKDIAREDTEYKWILQLDLDQDGNLAKASKDNTGLFQDKPPFKISEQTGTTIRNWCLNKKGEENERSKQSHPVGATGERPRVEGREGHADSKF